MTTSREPDPGAERRHGRDPGDPPDQRDDEMQLVATVLAGSEVAWQRFVERYLGVLIAALRRYLHDEDQVRTALADVLAGLREGGLRTYRGRSSVASWLFLVARNAATDLLRRELGRRELPRGLRELDELHREAYRLYHCEGLAFTSTLRQLHLVDPTLDEEGLVDVLAMVEARLTDRARRRARYDVAALSLGEASGRLLEYADLVREELSGQAHDADPLEQLIAREAEERALAALRAIEDLPEQERRVLSLRFEHGLKAREIADELDLGSQRRAYSLLERVLGALRRRLGASGDPDAPRATAPKAADGIPGSPPSHQGDLPGTTRSRAPRGRQDR